MPENDRPDGNRAPPARSARVQQHQAPAGSLTASTLNELNHNHDDRDHQEDMNESAHGVRGDKTQKPKDNQD